MATPVDENEDPMRATRQRTSSSPKRSGVLDEDTVVGDDSLRNQSLHQQRNQNPTYLTIPNHHGEDIMSVQSPSRAREAAFRLEDDLTVLQAERLALAEEETRKRGNSRTRSIRRSRSHGRGGDDDDEDFDITDPVHEKQSVYRPPDKPNSSVGKMFKRVHESFWLLRYFFYITPLVLIFLIPILLGVFLFKQADVGGVHLSWFFIWIEIVWLSLWAARILSKCLPWPIGVISSLFTNNNKKWRDLGKALEIPATLFFWGLACEISFLPTMKNHHLDGSQATRGWETTMNKVIISLFVCTVLNFVFKIIIQLIAIRFHLRTYADRIDVNKFQIASLVKLYQYSKEKISESDEAFEDHQSGPGSGARTPAQLVKEAQRNTAEAFRLIGDVTGKIAGDFAGKNVASSTHPHQVILNLLSTTEGSQVLARRLWRTYSSDDTETVYSGDLRNAFDNDDEAEAAFTMFDKDLNGDISMEELEAVCADIGRERKSITASLKDLDSVVGKLDDVFLFIVFVITILVFISLISTSAAGVLTSAGSTVLALSWLFSATAQEFLQSIIFVFVKHPFDVGDRVSIYGNTGNAMKGDDYFVKKISLLYTEFRKMEGHIVQAPNSYLNTLFILNQRRSGGLAEAVPVIVKFGTTLDQIEQLRTRLLEFVTTEKREYQANILTELREVTEAHSITMNVVFFYKSNWQNELLRLQRRNKFICALMVTMQELGIEGPRMRYPGQKESFPVYLQHVAQHKTPNDPTTNDQFPDASGGPDDQDVVDSLPDNQAEIGRNYSILRAQGRKRGESLAQMGRRVDFSLGMAAVQSQDLLSNVFEDRKSPRLPPVHSPERRSDRSNSSVGRSTSFSRSNQGINGVELTRVGTDSTLARERSSHRNRFFGRGSKGATDSELMEAGMANIPEERRLDPRTGFVSPFAVMDHGPRHVSTLSDPTPHILPRQANPERKNTELNEKVE